MILFLTLIASLSLSYYIYSFHTKDLLEFIFHKSLETYTCLRLTYQKIYHHTQSLLYYNTSNIKKDKVTITDIKILNNHNIRNFPHNNSSSLNYLYKHLYWNNLQPNDLLHICYTYLDKPYRIVFIYGQDLSILTTNTIWLDEGFYSGIDEINSHSFNDTSDLWDLMHLYAGPFGNFYDDIKHEQDPTGFLNLNLSDKLFSNDNQIINVSNILGEQKTFKLFTHTLAPL
jgi:hypothetical protein